MKVFLFWTLLLLISVSLFGCAAPVQQLSGPQPLEQAHPHAASNQGAKVAWYDTHTADMIAGIMATVVLSLYAGYLGYQVGRLL